MLCILILVLSFVVLVVTIPLLLYDMMLSSVNMMSLVLRNMLSCMFILMLMLLQSMVEVIVLVHEMMLLLLLCDVAFVMVYVGVYVHDDHDVVDICNCTYDIVFCYIVAAIVAIRGVNASVVYISYVLCRLVSVLLLPFLLLVVIFVLLFLLLLLFGVVLL